MNPSEQTLRQILGQTRNIAVLGASDRPQRPVDRVGRYLIAAGFTVLPVHPARQNVWGLKTYKSLAEIELPIDLVDLFRAPQHCPEHAREVLALSPRPRVFWMQSGITSPEAQGLLSASGVICVEDLCLMVEHRRLMA